MATRAIITRRVFVDNSSASNLVAVLDEALNDGFEIAAVTEGATGWWYHLVGRRAVLADPVRKPQHQARRETRNGDNAKTAA